MVKSRAAGADELTDGDELEYFLCSADCRARFEPPIPETYFGITYYHVVADANTLIRFLKLWASIAKLGGDEASSDGGSLPFDGRIVRELREDPSGLETSLWIQNREINLEDQLQYPDLTNKVRATFVMSQANVQKLKKLVSKRQPESLHASTFTVICAYVWVCILKSRAAMEIAGEDELEYFGFTADCRTRLDPPVPETYFGNCLTICFAIAKKSQLVGDEGFLTATALIGEAISKRPQNEEGVLKAMENFFLKMTEMKWERAVGVAGSPKLGFYSTDFGWGKPLKSEIISIDRTGAISLSECRDKEGDIEVGLSFPKIQMDAFASIFADGLEIL
ncbi:hypothetical protein F0562_033264 [Nyssa sinensis]|uniref:Uncharacterized protein n=1 Tax=Nyssa sinensis TaxID=561372 RepID=A0A5J5AQB6_9ASTE|nr:hypothetical protein F0562_033264 [Nyssa sinensis]